MGQRSTLTTAVRVFTSRTCALRKVAYALFMCKNPLYLSVLIYLLQYIRYDACTPMSEASCRATGSGYCVNCTMANTEQYASHSPCNAPAPRRGIWAVSSICSLHVRLHSSVVTQTFPTENKRNSISAMRTRLQSMVQVLLGTTVHNAGSSSQ